MKLYYKNRAEAGRILAERLGHLRGRKLVVLCLSEGATLVGAQIAMSLHAKMLLYKIKHIFLPNEFDAIAGISSTGDFEYSDLLSIGEIEDLVSEYHNFLDQERFQRSHELNVLLGRKGTIKRSSIRHHDVIIVADVLPSAFSVSMAASYLKTIAVGKVIAVAPVASLKAVDQLHIIADELKVLGVTEETFEDNHYFDENTVPTTKEAIKIMQNIHFGWRTFTPKTIKHKK